MIGRLLDRLMRFLKELRRRKVYRVAAAYLAASFVVVEAADLTLVRLGLPPWTVTLVIALVGLGFPIALVLAWALEVTPEGVQVDTAEEGSKEAVPATSSLLVGASVLALLLLGAWWYFGGLSVEEGSAEAEGRPPGIEERSIAVLPFSNLGGQKEARPLTRGLHDDLLTRLSNVSDLTVISRTSVEKYRNTDLSLPAIADSLGVRWIVEGGVQKAGERIQVNAQLIDPRTDAHRWAESYERELSAENLFAIQGEIAGEIAEALQSRLTAGEQERIAGAPTNQLDAYGLYIQGRERLDQRTEESIREAIGYFERALRQDSSYALGWAALAEAHGLLGGYGHVPLDSVLPKAWAAARRALAVDSTLAEAHAAAGLLHLYEQQGPEAIRKLTRALDLKPSLAQGHRFLGWGLALVGQPNAAAHFRRSAELNPMTPEAHADLGAVLLVQGHYEDALRQARRAKAFNAEYHHYAHHLEVMALYHLGRLEEGIAAHRAGPTWRRNPSWHRATRALLHVASGDNARALELQSELKEEGAPFAVAWIHAAFGKVDAAFRALDRVRIWTAFRCIYLRNAFPEVLRPLRGDPRYDELIRAANRQWGLNPDGSLPERAGSSIPKDSEADA